MTNREKRLDWTIGLLVVFSAAALLTAFSTDRTEPPHPKLQGTWKLNEDLTSRMREDDRPRGGLGGRGGFGGMGRRGGGGGGWGRGGGGRRGGGFPGGGAGGTEGEGQRENPRAALAALDELTITQQGEQVTITDKEGRTRVLKTDGSKVRDDKTPGGPTELRASWDKNGILTVEVKPDKGPKRTESYIVSNDGQHLYLTLAIEGNGRRPEMKIRRAYDPAAAEKPGAPESDEEEELELLA
ncbi:MAG: hypothetical protein QOF89_3521 [Acidobacteriota bacterium]|jgi:hypothetical protein|nr:hypothetical protein [Acidobacteriota bacterium]